jgi:hypothetical protein
LRNILGRLMIADDLSQKRMKPRRVFSVKRLECLRISVGYLLPNFPVVSQFGSPPRYSGLPAKKFAWC